MESSRLSEESVDIRGLSSDMEDCQVEPLGYWKFRGSPSKRLEETQQSKCQNMTARTSISDDSRFICELLRVICAFLRLSADCWVAIVP